MGTDRASAEGLREAIRAALNELGVPGDGYPAPVANAVDILRDALRSSESDGRASAEPRPDSGIDPRVVEAFDMLGAMWSWSEDNGYFATGSGAVLAAGRLLKEVVGRPAQPPARLSTPRTETSDRIENGWSEYDAPPPGDSDR